MTETYSLLGVDQKDIVTLEKYLQDYFTNILKKLKDLKAQSKQTDIYLWPMHFDITTKGFILFLTEKRKHKVVCNFLFLPHVYFVLCFEVHFHVNVSIV